MKKTCTLLLAIIVVMIIIPSCTKNAVTPQGAGEGVSSESPAGPTTINAYLSPGNTYSLNFATPSSVSITSQASHFRVSEMTTDKITGAVSYRYTPADKFSGTDEVSLGCQGAGPAANSGCPSGNHSNSAYSAIKIRITVSN